TTIGFSAGSQRTVSRFEDAYTSLATATLGRRMSPHWFFEFHGGIGLFTYRRTLSQLPTGPQYIPGATLGFKTPSHSFLRATDRTISDPYGTGATSSVSTTAGWTWGHRNRGWKIFASGGQSYIRGNNFPDVTAWLINTGFSQSLSTKTAVSVSYAYLRNST